jgi:hypothetical protein
MPETIFEPASEFVEIGPPTDHVAGNKKATYAKSNRNICRLVIYDLDKRLKEAVHRS